MTPYNEFAHNNFEKLDLFTTAITRAHGKNHPEAFDVRELFTSISAKTEEAGFEKPELNAEFTQLREVTGNYTIPGDVCETYAAVYNMLSEADEVYQAS